MLLFLFACHHGPDSDSTSTSEVDADGDGYTLTEGDCDDQNAAASPANLEVCDLTGTDENCDGLVDDADPSVTGQSIWHADTDGDGFGTDQASTAACVAPAGMVADSRDCDDQNPNINPSIQEVCDANATDEDCDGLAEDADDSLDLSTQTTFFQDQDGDGYGNTTSLHSCQAPEGYSIASGDCDDNDAAINPSASEVCETTGTDEDCDTLINEADPDTQVPEWFLDSDGDGYGDLTTGIQQCEAPPNSIQVGQDCDDTDSLVYPGATEWCDGKNNPCDPNWQSSSEDGLVTYIDENSVLTDISADWNVGSSYLLPNSGQINVCGGTYDVQLTTEGATAPIDVDIVGIWGAAATTLTFAGSILQVYNQNGFDHMVRASDVTFSGGVGSIFNSESYGGNIAVYDTDDVYASDSQGLPAQLLLDGCTVSGGTARYGGGIAIGADGALYGRVKLVDTVVSGNGGASTLHGGGIYIQSNGYLICENADIITNTATLNGSAHGGGVYLVGSSGVTTFISSTGCDWGTGANENFAGSNVTSDIEGSGLYPNPYNISGVQTAAFTCTGEVCQ